MSNRYRNITEELAIARVTKQEKVKKQLEKIADRQGYKIVSIRLEHK